VSLIGIDLGSSAIKVAAYADDGTPLAAARREVRARRPEPGQWEVDVLESRAGFWSALGEVAADRAVRADPPLAISFSSSGREVFPVAADGSPLGACLMTADTRGDEVAAATGARRSPEEWFRIAGHVPRRMDPVNRALWWRQVHPDIVARTRWFMNWHEYYSLLLAGRPVVDSSDAGTWATFDVSTGRWSAERIAEMGLDPGWLPEILPSGAAIGPILPEVAAEIGLPPETLVVTGAYDAYAAAVGSGAVRPGAIALACGSWHSFTTAVRRGWPSALVHDGLSVFPHPGPTGFGILATNPNGMSVIDWARRCLRLSVGDLEDGLAAAGTGPGPVFADPTFTPMPHIAAEPGFGGGLAGLTLASTPVDIVRGLLEGIACQFSSSVDLLRSHAIHPSLVRATGGGARLSWWLQLKADLAGIPVEVVEHDEPGSFGAAILAGVGAGIYGSVSAAVDSLVRVARRFEPDTERGALYGVVRSRLEGGSVG